ncbi:MAG: insulinase family protein, partial [Pseudomonadota bacterium]
MRHFSELEQGSNFHGFSVLRVEHMAEIRATAYEVVHDLTGAQIIHLHCDDKENLYSIGFRTPPKDSTGVSHILEHCALAGSSRYPVKDAFNELVKGTLQTFINAFTYPDKTIYPVASQVRADFFNLARVYTDLVFRPRLLRETFLQEGYHYEYASQAGDGKSLLNVSGIVYNEMKGAYSSADSLMYKSIQNALYPDNTYAFDSGGDPDDIPLLTHEQLKAFHRLYYSPSNARFFLYGDILIQDHLLFWEEMLQGFDRIDVESSIQLQPRKEAPSLIHAYYPVAGDAELSRKSAVNVAWMMAENSDYETVLLLEIIALALAGTAAGPLRKALVDSRLGEDLSPVTGFETDLRQVAFVVGLRGSDSENADQIERLILDTIRDVSEHGFDKELIEAALHRIEFHGKEIVRSNMPYAIILMGRAYHTWLYGGDPFMGLKFSAAVANIRKRWAECPNLFQGMLKTWFLDNPHRILAVLEPSRTYIQETEDRLREKMAKLSSSLSQYDQEQIISDALALKKEQLTPDSIEALNTLPKLMLADIPREIETIPTEKSIVNGTTCFAHNIFSNGIGYLDCVFDISDIPEELQIYLPLLGNMTVGMGAAGISYSDMAKRIALKTGGVTCHLEAGMTADGSGTWQKMIFRIKALHRNLGEAVKIIHDVLISGDLEDESRMHDIIAECKNSIYSSIVPAGHIFARKRAAAGLSVPAYLEEQWGGSAQFKFLHGYSKNFHAQKEGMKEKLKWLRNKIFQKGRLVFNVTGDEEGIALLQGEMQRLAGLLPDNGDFSKTACVSLPERVNTGIAIPAQVCYVAKALPAPTYLNPLSP